MSKQGSRSRAIDEDKFREQFREHVAAGERVAVGESPPAANPGVFRLGRDEYFGASILDLLEHFTEELYLAWLLLGEVFSSPQLETENGTLKTRSAHPSAVAARHWYSTAASAAMNQQESDRRVPVRLPGSYTVRGDWFLAIAKGSRSPRLGERAIDLLCSRRANITRLQHGLGLPVRDIIDENHRGKLWTALTDWKTNKQQAIPYEEILRLGASYKNSHGQEGFYWLWRSTIWNYDRHNRIWLKFLCRLLQDRGTWLLPEEGFGRYDEWIASPEKQENWKTIGGYPEFYSQCELLKGVLNWATPEQDPQPPQAWTDSAYAVLQSMSKPEPPADGS